jgi:hypothetical protein
LQFVETTRPSSQAEQYDWGPGIGDDLQHLSGWALQIVKRFRALRADLCFHSRRRSPFGDYLFAGYLVSKVNEDARERAIYE